FPVSSSQMSFQKPALFAAAGLLLVGSILINRSGQRELEIQAAARSVADLAHSAAPETSHVPVAVEGELAAAPATSSRDAFSSSIDNGLPPAAADFTENSDPINDFLVWAQEFSTADESM